MTQATIDDDDATANVRRNPFGIYVPEQTNQQYTIPEACKNCNNHPSNGGSGVCWCTLGTAPVIC